MTTRLYNSSTKVVNDSNLILQTKWKYFCGNQFTHVVVKSVFLIQILWFRGLTRSWGLWNFPVARNKRTEKYFGLIYTETTLRPITCYNGAMRLGCSIEDGSRWQLELLDFYMLCLWNITRIAIADALILYFKWLGMKNGNKRATCEKCREAVFWTWIP